MIDLDNLIATCVVALVAGVLVLSTYVVTMHNVSSDVDDWHDLAVNSQAAATQCITVLEGVDAELLSRSAR
tara:strand:+ start:92 stop:304 length:213 start_codon:yes stop_codon:yes gene_type:complete